jgi:hypothetical protein
MKYVDEVAKDPPVDRANLPIQVNPDLRHAAPPLSRIIKTR